MKPNKLVMAFMVLAVGLVGGAAVWNQLAGKQSVYMVIDIQVKEGGLYSQYVESVFDVVSKYGGKYLARGGEITPVAGDWDPERIVIIKFDSLKQLKKCFNSSEYLEIAPLREKSTTGRSIVVEGYEG